ncbi:MAG: GGDEF domain-containing protein [Pirellulales bacterium]|nr:GGDEF domain-containing protein [Pirellulales bacterium]
MSMELLFYIVVWVLPSVLIGVFIGFYWGRAPVLIRERRLAQEEREATLKALVTLMESTEQLNTDVGSRNTEIAAVGKSVECLLGDGKMELMQTKLLEKVTEVVEANLRLQDDLVVARYRMDEQARELDRTRVEARTDILSGVDNRKSFDEGLDYLLRNFKRSGAPFSLILCDIDHFNWINDTHGHTAGDLVVNHVGALLKSCLRAGDYVARYGGDEFVLLLPGTSIETAQNVADRIRLEVEWHNFDVGTNKQRVAITFSIGVTSVREGDTAEIIVQRVDRALYKSKQGGRNQTYSLGEAGELQKVGG